MGSPPGSTLLAVWSAGKRVDWCRYFQSFYTAVLPTQCSGVHISNVILSTLVLPLSVHGFFCIPHNVVQTQFTFVECGIKRSSHAFCAAPPNWPKVFIVAVSLLQSPSSQQPKQSSSNIHKIIHKDKSLNQSSKTTKLAQSIFLATLVALHFTLVSK